VFPEWSLRPIQILDQLSHEWGLYNPKGPAVARLKKAEKLTHYICLDCDAGFWFPLIPGDSDFYESISTTYVDARWDKTITRRFIRNSSSVLDVGAGPDPIFLNLTNRRNAQHATIDINPYANAKMPSGYAKFSNTEDLVRSNYRFNDITALHFLNILKTLSNISGDSSNYCPPMGQFGFLSRIGKGQNVTFLSILLIRRHTM
jgi:hypothetical protein